MSKRLMDFLCWIIGWLDVGGMKPIRVFLVGLLLLCVLVGSSTVPMADAFQLSLSLDSLNWAGYIVTGRVGSVTDVTGSWTVPRLVCSKEASYVSFWVGIDGFNTRTVEQVGIDAQCHEGLAYYVAWFEFFPARPVTIRNVSVKAGDIIYANLAYSSASGNFTITLTNETNGMNFTTSQACGDAKRSSVEWITEVAQSSPGHTLPLANFGVVQYGEAQASVGGVTGPLGSFGWFSLYESTTPNAQPTPIKNDSFTVIWKHN